MTNNLSTLDRLLRITAVIVIGLLYFTDQITGTVAVLLGLGSLILLTTGLIGYCPIYRICNISTIQNKRNSIKGVEK